MRGIIRGAAAGVFVALLAGCGVVGKDAARAPSQVPAGAHVISGAELTRTMSAAALASGTAHVRVSMPAGRRAVVMTGVIRYTAPVALRYRVEGPGASSQVIFTEDGVWVSGVPTGVRGRPWLRLDVDVVDELGWSPLLILGDVTGVGQLGDVVSFTASGSSTVPGTRQYTAQITAEEWLSARDQTQRERLQKEFDRLQLTGVTVMLFLDENDRPVKQILTLGGSYTLERAFSDWGKPVSITPPAKRLTTTCDTVAECRRLLGESAAAGEVV
jgi:hypothetical protein